MSHVIFIQVDVNDWSDLPKKEGRYWTSPNKSSNSGTMIQTYFNPADQKSRGYFRATAGSWFMPIEISDQMFNAIILEKSI
jgi:hypothetical protein